MPLYLYLTIPLFAQQFKAGLLAGIVTSQVDGDGFSGYNKAGLLSGAFVSSKLHHESKWSASFEITFIEKGSRKTPHPDKGDYADYRVRLNYVEVPLLMQYDFAVSDSTESQRSKFAVFGGIAIGKLIHSAEWDAFGQVRGGTPFQFEEISYILGLSHSITKHIDFDVHTQYSIIPVRKGNTFTYYQNWTYKFLKPGYYNNLIVFSAHYRF
jgi:hypothetical protein